MNERQPFEHSGVELAAHAQKVSPRRPDGTRPGAPRRGGAPAEGVRLGHDHVMPEACAVIRAGLDKYGDPPVSPPTGPLSPHRALAFHFLPTPHRARSQPTSQNNANPVPELSRREDRGTPLWQASTVTVRRYGDTQRTWGRRAPMSCGVDSQGSAFFRGASVTTRPARRKVHTMSFRAAKTSHSGGPGRAEDPSARTAAFSSPLRRSVVELLGRFLARLVSLPRPRRERTAAFTSS